MLIQLIGLTTYVNGGSGKRQQHWGHHVVRASSYFLHQFTPVAYFTDGKPHVGHSLPSRKRPCRLTLTRLSVLIDTCYRLRALVSMGVRLFKIGIRRLLTGTFYACLYYVPTYFARKMCTRTDVPILRIRHFTFVTSLLISAQTKTIWRYATADRFFTVPHTSRHLPAAAPTVWCLTTVTCNRQTHVDVALDGSLVQVSRRHIGLTIVYRWSLITSSFIFRSIYRYRLWAYRTMHFWFVTFDGEPFVTLLQHITYVEYCDCDRCWTTSTLRMQVGLLFLYWPKAVLYLTGVLF